MSATFHDAASATPSFAARPHYDPLTIVLHWTTVLLVLSQFVTAFSIDAVPAGLAGTVLQVHRSTGVALWLLVAFRLVWRFTGMRLPPFPAKMASWHIVGVHLSEYSLYALLLLQPLTGMADTLLRGRPFPLFGQEIPQIVMKNHELAVGAHWLHMVGAWTLAGVVGVHAGAALFHQFILGDSVLRSMLPRSRRSAATGIAPR
jgi:cytochrome b561